ncbi:MAG: hypothetical protein J5986_08580 [Roseburia sp.]|nr:hypothetical protein [Roseburia sp.]
MRNNVQKIQLNANQLKMIAIIAMLFDHFMALFADHGTMTGIVFRIPGRIVAPIMCFFIAEGYYYTSNRGKYVLRLFLFALISHIPYVLCFRYNFFQATSVIWGLMLGLIALTAVKEKRLHPVVKIMILGICCALAVTANWNYVAVLWIVGFGIYHNRFKQQMIAFSIIGIVFHIIPTFINFGWAHEGYPHWYQFGIFLAIPLLALYNGKRGKKSKAVSWFFYIFYPMHLIILFILKEITLRF